MAGLFTGAYGLYGGFPGLIYGSTGLSTPPGLLADTGWTPAQLFAQGEQGVWYDPSNFSTMFQDTAGTTPVTAVEQPVGLLLDMRENRGIGAELVTNNTFATDTDWTKGTGWTIGSDVATKTAGTASVLSQAINLTAGYTYRLVYTITRSAGSITPQFTGGTPVTGTTRSAAGTYVEVLTAVSGNTTLEFSANSTFAGTVDNVYLKRVSGNDAWQVTSTSRPVLSARYNILVGTTALATQSVTTVATNYTLRFEGPGSIDLSGTATGTYSAGTHTVTCTAGTLTLTVTGTVTNADLRAANDGVGLPAYQRVTTSTDYDTTGFPLYLRFDGTDDSLATGNINFTGTDKVSIFAGVRKLSDAGSAVVCELSGAVSSFQGSFAIFAPITAAPNFTISSRGSAAGAQAVSSTVAAPNTAVLTGRGDIANDVCNLRRNGVQIANSTADQGSGNYGNYPLYIGSRAGSSLRFNGRIYSLIIRGAQSTNTDISSAEAWVNGKTRAY